MTLTLEEMALHEAAHAVVGVVVGLPIGGVAIDHGIHPHRRHGACWPSPGPIDVVAEWVEQDVEDRYVRPAPYRGRRLDDYLVFLLAGGLAVAHARGVQYTAIQKDAYHDRFTAEWLAAHFAGHPYPGQWVHDLLLLIEEAARRHVVRHWRWIEVVAHELVDKRQLNGDQVKAMRPTGGQ